MKLLLEFFDFFFIGEFYFLFLIWIYPQTRLKAAGDIGYFDFRSVPFFMNKNLKNGTCNVLYVPFFTFSRMENGTDWKLK